MYINRITLINFKRFRRLAVDLSSLVIAPKLVLVIGSNGTGKSSLFDAFEWLSKPAKDEKSGESTSYENAYYARFIEEKSRLLGSLPISVQIDFSNGKELQRTLNFIGRAKNVENVTGLRRKNLFYGRSALRQAPRLASGSQKKTKVSSDIDRPKFYIEPDERFHNDICLWKNEFADRINQALGNIFGIDNPACLNLIEVVPPAGSKPARIKFRKGLSVFGYDVLSSGEKEIFGILLNLSVRRKNFQDTIYFIDELDAHLNTGLQYAFLKEVTENWIPENCQLWTASHSLGFIQYARESKNAAIINFDGLDFDVPQTIIPQPKESLEVYNIAIPKNMVGEIFRDKSLIFCENHDAVHYNSLGFTDRIFLPAKDKNDVYFCTKNRPELSGLMDKDYLTPKEIELIRQKVPNLFILNYYSIESYLYHPENLAEANENFDAEDYKTKLCRQKQDLYENIILGLKQARSSYKVLSLEKATCKNAEQEIIAALKSEVFEVFYPYLDMKQKFNRENHNVSKDNLAKTIWFRLALLKVFEA